MNEIKIWNYDNLEIRTIEKDGEPWWVLSDVCKVLELSNPSKVAQRLDEDERSNFELGRQGTAIIINESGLYSVILRSDKPQAKPFRKWVTSEVLPSIRRTGGYQISQSRPDKSHSLEVKEMNARVRMSNQYLKLAAVDTVSPQYKNILVAKSAEVLAGEPLLPLPKSEQKMYSATEIGDRFGVTAQKVGRIANLNGLKTEEYGEFYRDKSPYSSKEVDAFRYNDRAVEQFKRLLA